MKSEGFHFGGSHTAVQYVPNHNGSHTVPEPVVITELRQHFNSTSPSSDEGPKFTPNDMIALHGTHFVMNAFLKGLTVNKHFLLHFNTKINFPYPAKVYVLA